MKLVITGWAERYENHETRKIRRLAWVPLPNRQGLEYRKIAANKYASDIFAAWVLMLQLASMPDRENRTGELRDGERWFDADSMSLLTGFPKAVFERGIPALLNAGWITDCESAGRISRHAGTTPGESPAMPGEIRGRTEQNRTEQNNKAVASLPFASDQFKEAWNDFREHRKRLRKPMTVKAEQRLLEKIKPLKEHQAVEVVYESVERGWLGLFPDKYSSDSSTASKPKPPTIIVNNGGDQK